MGFVGGVSLTCMPSSHLGAYGPTKSGIDQLLPQHLDLLQGYTSVADHLLRQSPLCPS